MSKLDIQIEFDRLDRTYRGGQSVSGRVTVEADRDVKCDGLFLERLLRTHGRGNTFTRFEDKQLLATGHWRAGRREVYPFSLTAPAAPATYRGELLNIDHYVKVHADVPWGIDPKHEEEFVVVPGTMPVDDGLPEIDAATEQKYTRMAGKIGIGGGIAAVVIGLLFFFPCGIVLIPLGIILIVVAVRNILAERKLGEVAIEVGERRVQRGMEVPVTVMFQPRARVALNQITATLEGEEVCVSGSGTNKTTHTHRLHKQEHQLLGPRECRPGELVEAAAAVRIPEDAAYSLSLGDSKVRWEIKIRIDIPRWPDWTDDRAVHVVPEFDDAPQPAPAPPAEAVETLTVPESGSVSFGTPVLPTLPEAPPPPPTVPTSEAVEPPAPSSGSPATLEALFERVLAARRWGDDRDDLVRSFSGTVWPCVVVVERVSRTYSYDVGEAYRDGRTMTGKIKGTEYPVSVLFKSACNEALEQVDGGAEYAVDCTVARWDRLYERLDLREA